MQIAICMIVKNEEAHLAKCLDSVKGLGEIYILDTGSTDKTCEIARQYTDKVFENEYKWNDSFAEARNYILDIINRNKINEKWVLSIDADNVLEDGGKEKIIYAIDKAEQEGFKTISVILEHDKSGSYHYFPNIFKREGCRWIGAIHNYISVSENNKSDIKIVYGYSEAHKKDPDRALRILTKEVNTHGKAREMYYLAREYWYRRDYTTAIEWYKKYLNIAIWPPEIIDAKLMVAKCYKALRQNKEALGYAMEAIAINNDFKEALEFIADIVGPKNSERWINFAYNAQNQDVLFVNINKECSKEHYNDLYVIDDCQRYKNLYLRVAEIIAESDIKSIIDVGCGIAELSKYVKCDYTGIDFSEKAIAIARTKTPNVSVEDIYSYVEANSFKLLDLLFKKNTYVILEVLEHIDDLKLLNSIEQGSRIIASVPSFSCPSHLRRYTKKIIEDRYKGIININTIERFNWENDGWVKNNKLTNSHITLFTGVKK